MSEAPEALRALIARANEAGPGPERLAKVRARLESQLGPLDVPRASPATSLGPRAALAGLGVVAALVTIGAWLGAGPSAIEPTSVAPATEIEAAHEEPLAPSTPEAEAVPTAPVEAAPAEPDAIETPEATATPRGRRPSTEEPVAPPAETELDRASSLREEIALLDRALRASEAGEPVRARAALEEHRARFPSGTLSPERDRMLSELPSEAEAPAPQ